MPARALLTAILLAVVALLSCAKPSAFTARSVVLFVLDPLAAGGVGSYGSPDARTPFLDRLARGGGSFRTCVSSSPDEAVAAATLLGGVQPWQHGVRGPADEFRPDDPPLAELLADGGMETAAFLDREVAAEGLDRGFATFEPVGRADAGGDGTAAVSGVAAQWVGELPAEGTFFLVAMMPPDGDRGVGRVVRALEETGHLQRTLLLATSLRADGEELASEVPLVAWGPFPFRGGTIRSDLSSSVDVLPTVLEALRVGTPANRPGRALQKRKKPFREAALNAYAEADRGDARALRTVQWKYVAAPAPALFDLQADPAASIDVVEARPALADSLGRILGEPR